MDKNNTIIIKRLTSDDVSYFKDDIIQYIYESNIGCAFMENYSLEDALSKWIELYNYSLQCKAILYGAILDNEKSKKLVGFLWAYEHAYREDIHRFYVSILHVQKEYRSFGIGKELMNKVENEAISKGYSSVYLHAEVTNDKGIRFYNRNGYETERVQLVKRLGLS